jgi:hypothetical protein
MNLLVGFLLALVAEVACADSRNLDVKDLQGFWQSNLPTTAGEVDELEFYPDGHVRFLRTFKDNTKQEFMSQSASRVNDLEIVELSNNGALRYKLVLAGWLTARTKKLFGTMFMYEPNGHLFNGLPVSFRQEIR